MSRHERFPDERSSPDEAEATTPVGGRRSASRWIATAFLLGLAVLLARLFAVRGDLLDRVANPPAMKLVMLSVANPTATIDIPDDLFADGAPSGMSARAMSVFAQANGQTTTAERWLIHGLADRPSAYLSQFELCLLYWERGQRMMARETCRGTKASVQYWLSHGYRLEDQGQPEEALAYYDIATAVDPNYVRGWYVMGRTLFGLNRYDEAIVAYERMMVLDPTPSADVYEALGWSYLKLNNLELARDVLNRGLGVFPDQRTYYLAMADTFRAEDDLRAADSWYARMLQRWPNDVQAWAGRGDVAAASGQTADAVRFYREAVENQPQGFGYWLNLASSAWAGGDMTLATEAYEQARALQPDNPSVLLQVGRFYVETERTAEAQAVYEHVLQLQPDNHEAAVQLAAIVEPQPKIEP